jgi:hypothetical protein
LNETSDKSFDNRNLQKSRIEIAKIINQNKKKQEFYQTKQNVTPLTTTYKSQK